MTIHLVLSEVEYVRTSPSARPQARRELEDCRACPRDCGVNRLGGKMGACSTGRHAVVSSAFPHFGEESVLQGGKIARSYHWR